MKALRNVGIVPQHYTASQSRRFRHESLLFDVPIGPCLTVHRSETKIMIKNSGDNGLELHYQARERPMTCLSVQIVSPGCHGCVDLNLVAEGKTLEKMT
jgi:hypothetical protein